jgi:hypothetical protein
MLDDLSRYEYDIDNLYFSCSFNLTVNISITGKCKNSCFTCCVNMPHSKDTNNLGNVTPYIEIQPYHWDVILDSIIFFYYEFFYQWIIQTAF